MLFPFVDLAWSRVCVAAAFVTLGTICLLGAFRWAFVLTSTAASAAGMCGLVIAAFGSFILASEVARGFE
jgi:hypothetical protein